MQIGFNLDMVKILYHGFAIRTNFFKGFSEVSLGKAQLKLQY